MLASPNRKHVLIKHIPRLVPTFITRASQSSAIALDEWSIFYLLLPSPSKAQAIYLSNPYSGWFSHFIYRFGKHRDRLSVSYGRIPRPVQAPSGTTAHTTKNTRHIKKTFNSKLFLIGLLRVPIT